MVADNDMLEETTEIQDADYNIPRANLIIYGIIVTLCLFYLILFFKP
jgi:hypothetical protein